MMIQDTEVTDWTDTSGVRLRPCNANEVLLSISETSSRARDGTGGLARPKFSLVLRPKEKFY